MEQIILRAPEPTDIDQLYVWENDSSLWHHGNTIAPLSRYDLEQFVLNSQSDIYQNHQLRLMVVLKETNKAIGTIDLFEFDPIHQRAGVGILIDKPNQLRGFASEALQLLIEYAFSKLHLHQLYCSIISHHSASMKLFIKNGFEVTATFKQWLLVNQTWEDVCFLQLIQK